MHELNGKMYLTYDDIQGRVSEIIRQINASNWKPDYIVGLTRGGLLPATLVSQYMDVPMHSLDVSLRDSNSHMGPETNAWMAEDAFGYVPTEERDIEADVTDGDYAKKILIVDDINDTGETLNWIINDWQSSCLPTNPIWNAVWNGNVRFATIVNNESSDFNKMIDYSAIEINKQEKDVWVVFPTEEWWIPNPK